METPTGNGGGLREGLRSDAQKMTGTAKDRLASEVDSRKGAAAEQARSLSSALGTAADQLGPESPSWLRSILQQGAQAVDRLSQTVEQKDARQLAQEVQQLARQNPGTFLAGCAAVGFAAARVFKAGGSDAAQGTQTSPNDTYTATSGMQSPAYATGGQTGGSEPSFETPAFFPNTGGTL